MCQQVTFYEAHLVFVQESVQEALVDSSAEFALKLSRAVCLLWCSCARIQVTPLFGGQKLLMKCLVAL